MKGLLELWQHKRIEFLLWLKTLLIQQFLLVVIFLKGSLCSCITYQPFFGQAYELTASFLQMFEGICTDSPTLFKLTPGRWGYAVIPARRACSSHSLFQGKRMDVIVLLSHRGWQVLGRQTGSGHLGDRWLPPPAFPHLQQLLGAVRHSLPQTWGEPGHTVHFALTTTSEEHHLFILNKQWLVYKHTLNV